MRQTVSRFINRNHAGLSRAKNLCVLIACVFCLQFQNPGNAPVEQSMVKSETVKILVGTYTGEGSEGIYALDFDPSDGTVKNSRLLVEANNPSFLAISQDQKKVFAVNETREGHVSSYKWDADHRSLIFVNSQPSEGDHPCHLELNPAENLLAVANYSSGTVSVFQVAKSGEIRPEPQVFQHSGSGPVKPNQNGARAHCVKFDANGKFLYVADLGADQIFTYSVSGQGMVEKVSSFELDPGDGPRHLIFHPQTNLAFVVNELSSTVMSLEIDHDTGEFEKIDKVSTLPDGFTDKNYCADIHITENGKFLYASNRGHHSIAVFKVSDQGELERTGTESVRGEWPRNFILSPGDKFLLAANQNSNNVVVFKIDPETGMLTFSGKEIAISKPVALLF